MSRNKDKAGASSAVTAEERRASYGRRKTDLTPDDIEMLGKLEQIIQEGTTTLEHAFERMKDNQREFGELKAESKRMLSDTQQMIATFQAA